MSIFQCRQVVLLFSAVGNNYWKVGVGRGKASPCCILYFVFVFVFVVCLEEDNKTGNPEASKEGVVDHIEDCDL